MESKLTDIQIKILKRLNDRKGDPNATNQVLSWDFNIPTIEIKHAVEYLESCGFIREESSINQINAGEKNWKISRDGEIKLNNLKDGERSNLSSTKKTMISRIGIKWFWGFLIPLTVTIIAYIIIKKTQI